MRRKKWRYRNSIESFQKIHPLTQVWAFRILVLAGGHSEFVELEGGFSDMALAQAIGLTEYLDETNQDVDELDRRQCLRVLKNLHTKIETTQKGSLRMPVLEENIQQLKTMAGLSEVDCKILLFAVLIHNDTVLENAADLLGSINSGKLVQIFAMLLDLSLEQVKQAISSQGRLERSGLLKIDRTSQHTLKDKLEILSERFANYMLMEKGDPVSMMSDVIRIGHPPQLGFADYQHLEEYLDILRPYLHQSIKMNRIGVNILLYGPPGTGKSELSRVIADDLACGLYEISSTDADDDPISGGGRMLSYRAAQNFLCQRPAVIVFDEVEDIFGVGNPFTERSVGQSRKAWMNRMLEENAIPTFWISNTIDGLDSAFVRRFDMVIQLDVPPRRQREKIIAKAGGDILSRTAMQRIAAAENVAPGVVTRACSVIRAIKDTVPPDCLSGSVELLMSSTLEAQNQKPLPRGSLGLPEYYDIDFVNSDIDLHAMARGLSEQKEVRICLSGPSGTGKSAFGQWVADSLDVPLHVKKPSDILGPYVGMSERHVAQAFREAEREGALLMIDEVDSFLRDRRGADRSWEVTLVNEMLTQMESFPGIFIASTNLMDGIDQAALRRFDLKIKFGYLRPEQAWQLFVQQCKSMGHQTPSVHLEKRIREMRFLTPGDFATIYRQQRFRSVPSPDLLVEALKAECALKEGQRSRYFGFM
jgi:SpoVK/Ycf46/Vps4 family AAA+-type ATPase